MNFSVFTKPLCRFLIHRYMGQYLKTELTSDQLEFHLADGTATVQGVMLNSDYINETIETSGIKIISFVDGYVEELTVCVPWKRLLNDSTIIKVSGLQITLTPIADINTTNTQELVSSFIGSIASSMDLAKSVIVDEQLATETDSGGIEQFASLIDQIISRIKVIFENITIRIESYSELSGLCTGIEIQIDKMEFLDENLEEQMKNKNVAITEQPARLYTMTDLNKLLHIQGVRLYTDIWTPLKNNKLINSQINSSDSEGDAEMTALNFQSCYSHFSSRSNSNTATRPQNLIPPNPILFAQFFSEKHTLRIRVNNSNNSTLSTQQSENSYFNKRIDIDIFLGGSLYIFLTPSQIMLLQYILSLLLPREKEPQNQPATNNNANANNFGGLPMNKEHFNRMMEQIQGEFFEAERRQKFTQKGTWSGSEQYFEFTDTQNDYKWRKIIGGGKQLRPNSPEMEIEEKNHSKTGSTTTLVERRPNVFTISLRAPTLIILLTYDDPLSKDSMDKFEESTIKQTFPTIVNEMVEKAEHFFKTASQLKLNKMKMNEQGAMLSNLFNGGCLRLLANGFFGTYSLTNECQRNLMKFEGHLDECDFKECLWLDESSELQIVDIMCLSNSINNVAKSVLTFRFKNTLERENNYMLNIDIEKCKLELDPSIVDRISNILFIQPYFLCKNSIGVKTPKFEAGTAPLDDKLLQEYDSDLSFSLKCYCALLELKLRIPIADQSKIELPKKRGLREEVLLLEFEGTEIVLPKSVLVDIPVHWTMHLQCKVAKGIFSGDPNLMECTNEAMTFFCADATNAERRMGNVNGIKFSISYDKRNKSLSKILLAPENMTRSITESIFNVNDRERIEGPFSTKETFHFKDGSNKSSENAESSQKLIKAGSRKELMEFADECRTLSNLLIDISISQMNFSLPSRKFLEILFNRFANDLTSWEPKGAKFKKEENVKEFIECQSAFIHENEKRDKDELSEITNYSKSTTIKRNYRNQKMESHQFSFGIHIEKVKILIQRSNNAEEEVDKFQSQLGMELLNADIFLVHAFKGDPNLTYFFTTSTNAELYHKNLFTPNASFCNDVTDFQTFMLPKSKENLILNEVLKDHNFERVFDDNFAIALKMYFHENTNTKDILLAFELRNSLIHFRPFEKCEYFWAKQLADYFNIVDYGMFGYIPPTINADIRIQLSSVYLGYDHSTIIPNSPFQLRLEIGSSYINTNLFENMDRLKFDCIFEDINLWMRKKIPESVKFDAKTTFYNSNPTNQFVKILMADSIHFILAYTLFLNEHSPPAHTIDFACADQNLKLWLCSDTIVEFLNIFKEFFCSEIVKNFLSSLKLNKSELEQKENKSTIIGENIDEYEKSVQNDKNIIKRKVSQNEEERLVRDLEAAIHDIPTIYHTNVAKQMEKIMMGEDDNDNIVDKHSEQAETELDDQFILINVPTNRKEYKSGIGITQIGNRLKTHFYSGSDFEFISTEINITPTIDVDEQPLDQSTVLISYKMRFSSLTIYLFGGSDFADSARGLLPQKLYSQWEMSKDDSSLSDEVNSQGGRYRDHTVLVEIKFTRLSTICKLFNETSPNFSSVLLELGDFSIIDHLSISQINEMVHRLEIEGQPRSSAPFLKVFLKEDQLREAIIRITLAPIRLNFDQDTLDFLIDFKNDLTQGLRNVFDIPPTISNNNSKKDDDVPVMELPKTTTNDEEFTSSKPTSRTPNSVEDDSSESSLHQIFSKGISFNDLRKRDEQAANIEDLFSEDDVVFGDSVYDEKCSASSRLASGSIRQTGSCSTISENVKKELEMNKSKSLAAKTTFIKDFTFSSACRLRIDYEAKNRIRTENQGPFLAFLLGMTNLKKTELVLKEIKVEKGFLGFARLAQFVVDEWQNDIINKQLRNVVGGVAVINAIVQLAQGFKDLVVYPLEEYHKENGQLARGLQRGTSSFGLNAATAAIDATQRIVGLVQNIAELTYDILNPNFVYQPTIQPTHIPGDLREGFSLACETVREGIVDTTQSLQSAAERDRARGGWGVGILRHITPTAIRPIVVASKATSHVLGGLKNQLKPEEHKEEMRKWRHNAINGKRNFEQLRRQQSTSSITFSSTTTTQQQPTSSSGSYNHRTYDISQRKNW